LERNNFRRGVAATFSRLRPGSDVSPGNAVVLHLWRKESDESIFRDEDDEVFCLAINDGDEMRRSLTLTCGRRRDVSEARKRMALLATTCYSQAVKFLIESLWRAWRS
jgi:hypothetical protein